MLPAGKVEKRRTSSLFVTLAPPRRGPLLLAKDKRRAPKPRRGPPDGHLPVSPLEAAGPDPPPTLAGAPKGGQEGCAAGTLGRAGAGCSAPSPPSFLPSRLGDPAQDSFPPPPPPPDSDPFWVETFAPTVQEGRRALPPSSLQASSTFPAGLGQVPVPSSNLDRAGETDKPVEKAVPTEICAFCHKALCSGAPAIQAMNKQYHAKCFMCRVCDAALAGQRFFQKEDRPLCPACYQNALEKCAKCQASIWNRIVRALGSGYHPECFVCVECGQTIGNETFAVDEEGQLHCLGDFYRKFASVCSACEKPITPAKGRDDYRIECLGRSFHENCYRCQSCQILLSPEPTEDGCYPLNGCLFCKVCHIQHKASSR